MTDTKELTVQERAAKALGLSDRSARLSALAESTKDIIEITNPDGYKQVHSARMVLKNERVDISKLGKAARDDATAFSKAVIAEEKRLIEIISPEEVRLQALQTAHDQAIEAERQAKIDAEIARVESIKERIDELRGAVAAVTCLGAPHSEKVLEFIGDIEGIAADDSFQEFRQEAEVAKLSTLAALRELHTGAVKREDEAKRIEAERAELEALRAEQANAAKEAQVWAALEEEKRKKERAALEAKRKEQEAEQKRLNDERIALEAEQAKMKRKAEQAEDKRKAKEKAERNRKAKAEAAARKANYPGEEAIVDALVEHFEVTPEIVMAWLLKLRVAA